MKVWDKNSFWVFDLDDTLYFERDYQASGFREVAKLIDETYGCDNSYSIIQLATINGVENIFDHLCDELNLPASFKETMLWTYRLHFPAIQLRPGAKELLEYLHRNSSGVAILTDGRSRTQRLKLQALDLVHVPCYVSEDYDEVKPNLGRYQTIMDEHPASRYIYVGDNPSKDFIAPNRLGWTSIGLKDHPDYIHRGYNQALLRKVNLPTLWIDDLTCVFELIDK